MTLRNFFAALWLISMGGSAYADASMPIIYSRANIAITRMALPPHLPWLVPENPVVTFDVEVRDAAMFYKQKDWFSLSGTADNQGVMVVMGEPTVAPITRSPQYAPLDVVMADGDGKITQIIPGVKLSELAQDIFPDAPIMAFVFLKGGTCERQSIHVGDRIGHAVFRKSDILVNSGNK